MPLQNRSIVCALAMLGGIISSPNLLARDLNVLDIGAVADGTTDCTAAFQKALDDVAAGGGGIVNVPAGKFAIKGNLKIPAAVTLQGTFRAAPSDFHREKFESKGSVLLAYAGRGSQKGAPFIQLVGTNPALAGLIVIYPEIKMTDVPPVPYPPTVQGAWSTNAAILDCCFMNSYEAIHIDRADRFLIRNVVGYPAWRGIYVEACIDIGRIENVHFWPFGIAYAAEHPYCKWINLNGTAFEFGRTDWQYVVNTFCFGYGVGYKFSRAKLGMCNGNFLGIGADCCRRGILVEDSQAPGLLITNAEIVGRWGSLDSVGLEILPTATEGKVSLNNCSFWGPTDKCIWSRSPLVQFTTVGSQYAEWDTNGTGAPAIQIDAGKAIVQANTFAEGETHVLAGEKARSVIVGANQATHGVRIDNRIGKRLKSVANEECVFDVATVDKSHFRVDIGSPGDQPFVSKSFRSGVAAFPDHADTTMRWTSAETSLKLPVIPGKAYEIVLDIHQPETAIDAAGGLYLGKHRVVTFPPHAILGTVGGTIPAGTADHVELHLRSKSWQPSKTIKDSWDQRPLAIGLFSVTMKAAGATTTQPAEANAPD